MSNTSFASDVCLVEDVKMGASGVEVNPASSLLLKKAAIGFCGVVGSKGHCSSSSSFSSSITLL